jgi:hypothetical protein
VRQLAAPTLRELEASLSERPAAPVGTPGIASPRYEDDVSDAETVWLAVEGLGFGV